jgi:hypothetical protein
MIKTSNEEIKIGFLIKSVPAMLQISGVVGLA